MTKPKHGYIVVERRDTPSGVDYWSYAVASVGARAAWRQEQRHLADQARLLGWVRDGSAWVPGEVSIGQAFLGAIGTPRLRTSLEPDVEEFASVEQAQHEARRRNHREDRSSIR